MKRTSLFYFPVFLLLMVFWFGAGAQTDTVYVKVLPKAIQSQRFHLGLHAIFPTLDMPGQDGKSGLSWDLRFVPSFCILPFNKLVMGVFLYPSKFNSFRVSMTFPDSLLVVNESGEGESSLYLYGLYARYYLLNIDRNIFVELAGAHNARSRNFLERDSSFQSRTFERQYRVSVGAGVSWFSDGLAFEAGVFVNALHRYSLGWSESSVLFAAKRSLSWSVEPRVGLVYYF
jgi:hypothetical protein